MIADRAVGGGATEACHYRRGHVMAVEDLASVEVAAWDGRGHVVADEAVGGGGQEPCHYRRRGHVTAVEGTTSVEVGPLLPTGP